MLLALRSPRTSFRIVSELPTTRELSPPTQAAGVHRRGSSEKFQLFPERRHAKQRNQDGKKPNKAKETLVLTSSRSGIIIGSLDILVDIGVPAEKEVIQ